MPTIQQLVLVVVAATRDRESQAPRPPRQVFKASWRGALAAHHHPEEAEPGASQIARVKPDHAR